MRYHFFLHYGWVFQNLGKEAVRTFMHTTVRMNIEGMRWSFIRGAMKVLQFNFEECWAVFITHCLGKIY